MIKGSEAEGRPGGRRVMQSSGSERRGHEGGRKEGREERKEELLLLGIQLSRNVLTVKSHTVGEKERCILGGSAEVTPPVLVRC